MKQIVLTSCVLLALAAASFAGDFATLDFIGFSKDGRYLAYEEYGVQDGSGYPYSDIYFIDTDKNSYASAPVRVLIEKDTATDDAARPRARLLAAKKIAQFRIIKGNKGTLLVSHLLTDLSFGDGSEKFAAETVKFAEIIGSFYRRGDYELTLTPVPTKVKACDAYEQDIFMMELKLTNKEDSTTKYLQKDASLPSGRGCVTSYALQDIYSYNGILAAFIRFTTPGFEGPDMRFMAVSGKLK